MSGGAEGISTGDFLFERERVAERKSGWVEEPRPDETSDRGQVLSIQRSIDIFPS
jgi:hypothetical protein